MKGFTDYIKTFSFREWVMALLILFISLGAVTMYFSQDDKVRVAIEESNTYKNKANEEYQAKTILIQSVKELKKSNDSLYAEYKKIKDQDPLVVIKTNTEYVVDTIKDIKTDVSVTADGRSYAWAYNDTLDPKNSLVIKGITYTDTTDTNAWTDINEINMKADLTLDVIKSEADNAMRIIARSNNPYFKFTNIEGAILDPTKNETIKSYFPQKKWSVGLQGGYGFVYSPKQSSVTHGAYIGLGVSYKIFSW